MPECGCVLAEQTRIGLRALHPRDAIAPQAAYETAHFEHAQRRQNLGRRQAAGRHDMVDGRRFGRHRGQNLGTGHLSSGKNKSRGLMGSLIGTFDLGLGEQSNYSSCFLVGYIVL